jgi:3'-5' exoribonuclease
MQAIPSETDLTMESGMEQPPLTVAKEFVRDLIDGQDVDSVFVVRERSRREKRDGAPFLKLLVGDVTGGVDAVVWDDFEAVFGLTSPGAVVRVAGRYSVHERYGPTLTVRAVQAVQDGDYDLADLMEGPPVAYAQLSAGVEELVETVQQPHLRQLLRSLIAPDTEIGRRWHEAPAAKYYHQAYRHGLLEHCLSVAQGVSAMAATFPGIDRDVAVTGALLHDIGKVDAYQTLNGAIELTDGGRLLGEIALGYYLVRRAIERVEGFPPEAAQAVLHIVLAHHGKLEHGSPVVPCTREATLVHMIDNLGGTLGSFDRIERSLADGERWSAFDRALSGAAYFAPREAA